MKLTTTLQRIKDAHACADGYRKLAKHLGGRESYGRDTEINLLTVLDSNGVQDMLWCLRCTVEDSRRTAAQLAIEFATESLPLFEKRHPNDLRPRQAIEAACGHLAGTVTLEELAKARLAADYAAYAPATAAIATAATAAAYAAATAAITTATSTAAYAAATAATATAAHAGHAAHAYAAHAGHAGHAAYSAAYACTSTTMRARQAEIIRAVLS
jgi:hypothetical protein